MSDNETKHSARLRATKKALKLAQKCADVDQGQFLLCGPSSLSSSVSVQTIKDHFIKLSIEPIPVTADPELYADTQAMFKRFADDVDVYVAAAVRMKWLQWKK
jgi:hypothetical protein